MNFSAESTLATVETYEHDAVAYAQRSSDRTPLAHLHSRFVELVKPTANVLDLGSGPGHDSVELIRRGLRPTCCEPAFGLLNQARLHDELKGKLVEAEARSLPFASGCFHGIWACASLLHIPKHDVSIALGEAFRVLKDDGVLMTSMQEGSIEGVVAASETDMLAPRFYAYYAAEEWQALVEAAGFVLIEQRVARVSAGLNPGATGWIETFARKP